MDDRPPPTPVTIRHVAPPHDDAPYSLAGCRVNVTALINRARNGHGSDPCRGGYVGECNWLSGLLLHINNQYVNVNRLLYTRITKFMSTGFLVFLWLLSLVMIRSAIWQ